MTDNRIAWLEGCHRRLHRHIDEHYYPGALDDLRDLYHAALATPVLHKADDDALEECFRQGDCAWTVREAVRKYVATLSPVPSHSDERLREALKPLRTLLAASEGKWPKTPWKVVPSDGKPIIASDRGGNLFRGYIATWDEADLVVGIVNALPSIFAALDAPHSVRGGE